MKFFWMVVFVAGSMAPGVWAEDAFTVPLYDPATHQDIPLPGEVPSTPTPTGQPTRAPSPTATATPLSAFASGVSNISSPILKAPIGIVNQAPSRQTPGDEKNSPWMSLIGLGADIPAGSNMGNGYALGLGLDFGTGYRLDSKWSLWADLCVGQFDAKNNALTRDNNFLMIAAAFRVKYRFQDDGLSPYFWMGPGLAYNENRNNQSARYDPETGDYEVPINRYEVDGVAESGLGLDLKSGDGFHLFLQGSLIVDLTSAGFAGYASTDSPIVILPIEMGILFGY